MSNVEIFKKSTNLLSFDNPTLQNIGNDYNLTRERIRQIVKKISRNLKRHKDKYISLFTKEQINVSIISRMPNGIRSSCCQRNSRTRL